MPSTLKREYVSGWQDDPEASLRRNSAALRFLWHCSSPHGVRPLTGILLCGARTFLPALNVRGDCLASFGMKFNTEQSATLKILNPGLHKQQTTLKSCGPTRS